MIFNNFFKKIKFIEDKLVEFKTQRQDNNDVNIMGYKRPPVGNRIDKGFSISSDENKKKTITRVNKRSYKKNVDNIVRK